MSSWADHQTELNAWREAGAGEPLIFLHGLGGTRSAWGPQLEAFSDIRRCIAWDMPGYGGAAPESNLTYATIADRLAGFLDELKIEKADMVGLSFGGMHALHTAIRHPGRVGKMVLSNTSPAFGMNGTTPQKWKAARLRPIDAGGTPADMAPRVLDAIAGRPLETQLREDLIGAFGRISSDGFRAAVECLPYNDIRNQLGDITHESLVLVGDLDQETPRAYAQVLADGLPNSEFVVLENVGHLSPSEDPSMFNQLVRQFINR
jgi:3-oxoadipate enol-lactonase